MSRRINRSNKHPKGKVGCKTAEKLLSEKKKREERQSRIKEKTYISNA